MAGNVLEFTDANWESEVLASDKPVLVDFWAPWCGPCRMLAPTIEKLASEHGGQIKIGKLNTDENPNTPGSLRVSSIPTVIFFKGGKEVGRLVGVNPESKFKNEIEKLVPA
jgi:thioredoxin 1